MRIGDAAARAGVTVKAIRYYESLGLVVGQRLVNGYRDYDDAQVRLISEIHLLGGLGITAERSRPFLDCLASGNEQGDDCPASLATYREAIDELSSRMELLAARRTALLHLLEQADCRAEPRCELDVETPAILEASRHAREGL